MNHTIRTMRPDDKPIIMEMMRVFYASPAVHTNGSTAIFEADIDACVGDSPYAEGFVMEGDGTIVGYVMVAKSFSTEFGKPCIWIEDIYFEEAYRGQGLGEQFLRYVTDRYTDCIFRLEVEEENVRARRLYEKCGFEIMPYMEMKKDS